MAVTLTRVSKYVSSILRLCSRREADDWINEGKVLVNGKPAELGSKVKPGDKIVVKGTGEGPRTFHVERSTDFSESSQVKAGFPRIFLANKRAGYICDRTKERNMFAEIELGGAPRGLLITGGLDVMASGLIVLTDSAKLRNMLEQARMNQIFYLKCASKNPPDQVALRWLKSGPMFGKSRLPTVSTTLLQSKFLPTEGAYKSEISIAFKNGRFHDVRQVFKHIGLTITDAERRKYGPFALERLSQGQTAELNPNLIEQHLDKAIPTWRDVFETPQIAHFRRVQPHPV